MKFTLRTSALLFAAVMSVAACDDDDDDITNPQGNSRVKVVHASPDAPAVDVLVDNVSLLTNVAYQTVSPYNNVPSGRRTFVVRGTGTTTNLISQNIDLEDETDYTILAADMRATITPVVIEDDNTAPTAGNVKVRFIHASPAGPAVDVYVTAPGADLATATANATNVTFKNASTYISVPAGNVVVRLTTTGTKTVVATSATLALTAGMVRSVIALERTGGGLPVTLVVSEDRNP